MYEVLGFGVERCGLAITQRPFRVADVRRVHILLRPHRLIERHVCHYQVLGFTLNGLGLRVEGSGCGV